MGPSPARPCDSISVLVADSNQMQCQLLTSALRRRPEFRVVSCLPEMDAVIDAIDSAAVQVAILSTQSQNQYQDLALVRRLHLSHPSVAKVLLLESYDRDLVVSAFRSGVKGLFCLTEHPFRLLCKCLHCVSEGQVWANSIQLQYLLEVLTQVPTLRTVDVLGRKLLTRREEQVVALVADGLSNREIARELNLSEHTIKKYLFRIFDKLGISSRVELVLYAVSHGGYREAEWLAGAGS